MGAAESCTGSSWYYRVVVGLCYMTVAAAKRSEDKEIHLANFDKLRTEIPIALLFVFSVALAALGMRVHHQDYGVMGAW